MIACKYRSEILIAIAALAILLSWLPIRMRFPFDDTYITFRYAANLAHGFGIVWNPGGAHTEGYTNFLFMLLLVPFSWMGCDIVVVSQAIGVAAVVVSAIAIYRIVESGKWKVVYLLILLNSRFFVLHYPFLLLRYFFSIHSHGSTHILGCRRACFRCGYCLRLLLGVAGVCRLFLQRFLL